MVLTSKKYCPMWPHHSALRPSCVIIWCTSPSLQPFNVTMPLLYRLHELLSISALLIWIIFLVFQTPKTLVTTLTRMTCHPLTCRLPTFCLSTLTPAEAAEPITSTSIYSFAYHVCAVQTRRSRLKSPSTCPSQAPASGHESTEFLQASALLSIVWKFSL